MNRVLWGALLGSLFFHFFVIAGLSSSLSESGFQKGSLNRDSRVEIHIVDRFTQKHTDISDSNVNVSDPQDHRVSPASLQDSKRSSVPLPIRAKVIDIPTLPLPPDTLNMGGEVVVVFNISTRGKPFNIHVATASPPGFFEEWAMDSIKQGSYQPGASDTEVFQIRFIIEAGVASQR